MANAVSCVFPWRLHSRKRITLVYTLENIMKDKHAGADLLGRFRALVVA